MSLKQRIENNLVVFFLSALLAGFLAGLGAYESVLRIGGLEVASRQRLADLEMLRAKDRFLSLYLRWALMHLPPFDHAHTDADRDAARERLDALMGEMIAAAERTDSIVAVGKGQGRQTTLRFPDGSVWTVPPAFAAATAD